MTPFILHIAQIGTEDAARRFTPETRLSLSPATAGELSAQRTEGAARRDRLEAPSVASGDISPAA